MDMFTTMITPYTASGEVDFATAEKYVDWYFQNGLNGIFAVCQSSEIFYLTLAERVRLNKLVYTRAKELEAKHQRPFTVVSSGHVSDTIEGQIEELNAIAASGTDALILITNRLDPHNEGDDVWIANCEKLLAALPAKTKLGLYECPYPYKRLVTPGILSYCLDTGRFYYMKDTCCDADMIAARCAQLRGSHFKLLNANCQTLLASMRSGADGYCGIMCNYHPRLYAWLGENYDKDPHTAELVQAIIGTFGFTETGLPYPPSAKYHMGLCGIPTQNIARNRQSAELTPYVRHCMQQMKQATDFLESKLFAAGGHP
ncbi:MAG: dihydrodipicolinate synthase family protein [Clostridia bacterium]|nr:dihydrodipicolinate synthase family protein [Clostridia bacterium]